MTHKITMNVDQPGTAGADFAALADQFLRDSWHLPPEGDQSWREQDAQRIFSGHDEGAINEEPVAVMAADPPADEDDALDEPGVTPLRPGAILLSLGLATGLMFAVIVVSAPQILSAGFWNAPDSKAGAALVPVVMADAAPLVPVQAVVPPVPEMLRPSIADSGKAALPLLRKTADNIATSHRNVRIARAPVKASVAKAPIVKVPIVKVTTRTKQRGLPPIGAAYFASHTPAVPTRKATSADWKAEVARWDARANEIRARRENTKTD